MTELEGSPQEIAAKLLEPQPPEEPKEEGKVVEKPKVKVGKKGSLGTHASYSAEARDREQERVEEILEKTTKSS